ncbi:MAG: hypothetical protein ABFD92_15650 [Planctomycetaceae bacterium]|nr:hypothetical protein [Planctomycetaceae bacterium]
MNTFLVVRHQIGDFEQWKRVFEESDELRREYGIGRGWIFRDEAAPEWVTVMLQCQDKQRAQEFMNLDSVKDMIQRAGVKGEPVIMFVEQVAEVAELAPATDAWPLC